MTKSSVERAKVICSDILRACIIPRMMGKTNFMEFGSKVFAATLDEVRAEERAEILSRLPEKYCSRVNEHDGGGNYQNRIGFNIAISRVKEAIRARGEKL